MIFATPVQARRIRRHQRTQRYVPTDKPDLRAIVDTVIVRRIVAK
jgi:hypothetical protein